MALHLLERTEFSQEIENLYNDWNNQWAHAKGQLPDTFRVDLRHFHMPTPSRLITSNYGRRWGRMHQGLDIKVYIGDTIRSAFDGKVRVVRYEANGYGNFVVIRHDNGLETVYGHMSKHLVKPNQNVKAGDPIGLGGNTGRSTGSHLHFETRLCGKAINPALMFDFRNQDVTADFYTYRNSSYNRDSERATRKYGKPADRSEATAQAPASLQNNNRRNMPGQTKKGSLHKVAKGETLYSIARKHGISVDQLCKLNHIGKKMHVRVGQILKCS